jgi:formamidopyrimidine-DNA glycosylase
MPELPEVETSVRAIQSFQNHILESVEIHNPNLRWPSKIWVMNFYRFKNVILK